MIDHADFYGMPSFFITHAVSEIAGPIVRVYHYDKRGNVIVPQFIAIIQATDLAVITRDVEASARKSLAAGWGDLIGAAH